MASKVHSIGSIKTDVIAKTADFNAGMSKIEKRLNSLKNVGKNVGNALKKALNPKVMLGAALGGFGLGKAAKDAAAFGAKITEAGRKVGLASTEVRNFATLMESDGMGMERVLNTLTRANKRVGDLELEVRGPLQKLAKSEAISEAEISRVMASITAEGTNLIDVFDKLGKFAVKHDFSQSGIASLFDMVAGEDGRSMGAWIVQAIKQTGDLRAAMADAGRFETTTAEEYANLKDLDQQFLNVGKNIKDFIHKGMAGIAEPLTDIIEKVNKWILNIKNDPEFTKNITTGFQEVVEGAKKAFELAEKIVRMVEKGIELINRIPGIGGFLDDPKILSASPDNAPVFTGDEAAAKAPMGPGMASAKAAPADMLENFNNTVGNLPGDLGKYPAAQPDPTGRLYGTDYTVTRGPRFEPAGLLEYLSNFGESLEEYNNYARNWFPASSMDYTRSRGAPDIPSPNIGAIEDLDDVPEAIAGMTDSIRAFVTGAKTEMAGFKDFMTNIAQSILNNVIENTIVQPLSQGISGGFNSFFGTLWDGPEGGTGLEKMFGKIWPFAEGGRANPGLALVGERGPEVVDFSKPGMVYSNEQLRAAFGGGGGGASIVYNINSTDGPGVRAALAEATPGIVRMATANVGQQAQRPGGFRQQIRGRA